MKPDLWTSRVLNPDHRWQRARARARMLEAALALGLARLAIRCVSFKQLTRCLAGSASAVQRSESLQRQAISDVRRSVTAAARHLPGSPSCFARAVAAHAMLRRRRVSTTLFYGARAADGRGLRAHVWLRAGADSVVGHERATEYVVVAHWSFTFMGGKE